MLKYQKRTTNWHNDTKIFVKKKKKEWTKPKSNRHKPKSNRQWEMIKVREEINEIEAKK